MFISDKWFTCLVAYGFVFLTGCSNTERSDILSDQKITNSPPASKIGHSIEKIEAIYFSSLFLPSSPSTSSSASYGKEVDIAQQMKKLKKDGCTWEAKLDEDNAFGCTYRYGTGQCEGGSVTCQYLGKWKGKDIVATRERTGGSGVFSNMYTYSIKNGKIIIYDRIVSGDRGWGGFLHNPVYDGSGKIYFYARLSDSQLLIEAGIDGKKAFAEDETPSTGNGICGKCMYDLSQRKGKILSIIAVHGENGNKRIKALIAPKMHEGIKIFDEEETEEILQALKKEFSP
ncbi:MAG: hypothetical protein LBF56_01625 [Holosporales bacterium]|jgi:hypothetical protein|nr:hypothetical protein [Holosporales bacterium]